MALFDGCGGRLRRVRRERGEVRSEEDGWVCLDGLNRRIAQKPACPPAPAGHLASQTLASSLNIKHTHTLTHSLTRTHTHAHTCTHAQICTQGETAHTHTHTGSTAPQFLLTSVSAAKMPSMFRSVAPARLGAFPGRQLAQSPCTSLHLLFTHSTGALPLKPARSHRKRGHPTY
jgi:hypothetical protein